MGKRRVVAAYEIALVTLQLLFIKKRRKWVQKFDGLKLGQ